VSLTPDIAIVGAGPAGSVAAIILARHGVPVTLIEQHRFPRDKVCGECLSALGTEVLDRLGLLQPLLGLHPARLHRALLHSSDGHTTQSVLPRPMLGISRALLDAFLLQEARASGAKIWQPARVEGIDDSCPPELALRVRDLSSNSIEKLRASCVLIADGKSSLMDSSPAPTGDLGIKSHWTGIRAARDMIELFGCKGCYGGSAPIEGELWNLAFSVPAERVRANPDLKSLFCELCAENTALHECVAGARRVTDWLASPLPRFGVRRKWPNCIIPLGNAAAAIEPIGGEGMGLAMRSAELASDALLVNRGAWSELVRDQLQSSFQRLWKTRGMICRAGGVVSSNPTLSRLIFPLLSPHESLLQGVLQLAGK
jgi:menaquinone-9 beta-reductase